MLIFDQLKKNDPQLRLLAVVIFAAMFVLLAGLWWVQIVSARDYRASLETQSFRTVRLPAVRGKILDRNGAVLAENRPSYDVNLYLDELNKQIDAANSMERTKTRNLLAQQARQEEQKLGRKLTTKERKSFAYNSEWVNAVYNRARIEVASNLIELVSQRLHYPIEFDSTNFQRHCMARLALPYPVASDINSNQIARFNEQFPSSPGLDLELQSVRVYPHQTTAAHLLGHLQYDDRSIQGEEAYFSYRLPDYSGALGIEAAFDKTLHGKAGAESVLVNSIGYRQTADIISPAEPGTNVVLTLDLQLQEAAERALAQRGPLGANTLGAAVVMDVHTGDILALVSSPTYNPNYFLERSDFPRDYYQNIQAHGAEKNLATQENYRPGSIFKTVVALACLENGLDPNSIYNVEANPRDPNHGIIYVGRRSIKDTAPPGRYNFTRALIHSSNSYFITNGMNVAGIDKIVELGKRLHLGERIDLMFDETTHKGIGLGTRQETPGLFPDEKRVHSGWSEGDTANLCIGQGYIDVTPLQMTVLACALANGGTVLWPRLVDRLEPQDPLSTDESIVFPKGRVRDHLGVKARNLQILRDAMLQDVESNEGSGRLAAVPGLRICAKTGTAQNEHKQGMESTTWFLSFAPYSNPRYAVVVMVENGGSGGGTCAPIAHDIYAAIQQWEREQSTHHETLARSN